jgi:FKBP-type peptidyl-prolyl cis-trans isomerase FklB
MKTKIVIFATLLAVLVPPAARAEDKFKSEQEKFSYALGLSWGGQLKQGEVEVNYEQLLRGFKDAQRGDNPQLTETEMRETLMKLSTDVRNKMMEKQRRIAETNKVQGEAFLSANKTKPGVITLPNGLQYKVLAEGSGESPKPEDIVEVNYRGTLIDGTEFDASKPGQPFTTAANRVIRGWTEALTRMKPGAKWQLFIPPDLAYGERGSGPKIGPNSTLLFDVELLSFKPAPPPSAPPPSPAQPLTSDIIKVPSAEEMKKGAKIETIKAEDVERLQREAAEKEKAEKAKAEKEKAEKEKAAKERTDKEKS